MSREIRTSPRTIKKRIYKNFNCDDFINDMKQAKLQGQFCEMHNTEDINIAGDIFTKVFTEVLDKHAPIKTIQNRTNYVPYITDDIKALMKERNKLKIEATKTGSSQIFNNYKIKRNLVTTKLKDAKTKYYKSKFSENNLSPRELWSNVKTVLGNVRSQFPPQILLDNKLLSKPIEMATGMNEYFIKKIATLKTNTNITDEDAMKNLIDYVESHDLPNEGFKLKEISEETTIEIIKSLKGKKSIGSDWICGYSLKLTALILTSELQCLVNLTIRHGIYYSKWKFTKVLPGFKNKGTRHEAKYYRPISNISEISKIAEKAVYEQVYEYFLENKLFSENHHGFLRNHSTATALQHIVDIWIQSIECKKLSAALFLDLSAGFDVVNINLLLKKLKIYKFNQKTFEWFSSYLKGRKQSVIIESSSSPYLDVPWGVPQGSILGPLLFVIFIMELPSIIDLKDEKQSDHEDNFDDDNSEIIIYADDNTPTTFSKDPLSLENKIQHDGNKVIDWFDKNDMVTSADKTQLLIIGTRQNRIIKLESKDIKLCISINGEVKKETKTELLLGLAINNTLSWKHHLFGFEDELGSKELGLIKNLSKRIGILSKLRKYLPDKKFKQISEGLFTSKLIYCITVWGFAITQEETRKLQVLQNKSMRLISHSPYDTPRAMLLKKCSQLSVNQLTSYHAACQTQRIFTSKYPSYHHKKLFTQQRNNSTRSHDNYSANNIDYKKSISRGQFFYQSSKIWNSLPINIRKLEKIIAFKKALKPWVLANVPLLR